MFTWSFEFKREQQIATDFHRLSCDVEKPFLISTFA